MASMRHGIPRIDREIDNHLKELTGIDVYRIQILGRTSEKLDVFADQRQERLAG